LLAVQILGTADEELRAKFHEHKQTLKEKVAKMNDNIHNA
jgi:phosphoribosylcarboxyaminoimidazole (NCAIR) mutase